MSHTSISVCGILISFVAAFSATAQDASTGAAAAKASTGAQSLEEVVVTAQKREQALQEVPIAIQAFGGESLERQGIKTADDVLMQVPSASFQSATETQKVIQLRGIAQNAAVDPSVAYYLDEVPLGVLGYPFMPNIDALDLQRIEILRGPQGTLYGLGAMGGTVRVITADPDSSKNAFSARILAEGNTTEHGDESYVGSGTVNVPLAEDKLALRASVAYRHIGGWIDDVERGEDINVSDTFSIRTKLLYTPTEKMSIKLTYWRNEIKRDWINNTFTKNAIDTFGNGPAGGPEAFQDTTFNLYSAFISYDLGFATLENNLSYFEHEIPARFVIGTPPPPNGLGTLIFDTMDHSEALTNEFRLVSNGETAFQWIAGVFYRDSEREFFQFGVTDSPLVPVITPPSTNTNASSSYSIFGEASYGFADDLVRVLVGARYFHDDRDFEEVISGVQTLNIGPTFDSFNPRVNVTVKPNDSLMVYFNAAKGYRSGISNLALQRLGAELDGIDASVVEPDAVWTYEVGAKNTLFDGSLFLEGAIYYSKWTDFQFQGASSSGLGYNVNGGDAEIKGVEAGITWHTPIDGFNLTASGSYTDAEFDEPSAAVQSVSPLFVAGARLPQIPRWSGSVSMNYETPLADTGLDLVAGGAFTFRDGMTDGGGGVGVITDPRNELSLRAGVRTEQWEVTAFLDNVTDNHTSITSLTGTQWGSPFPRTMGVRVIVGF